MPHSKTGRLIEGGDTIVSVYEGGMNAAGIVVKVTPGAESCNVLVAPLGTNLAYVNAKDCIHADELSKLVKE